MNFEQYAQEAEKTSPKTKGRDNLACTALGLAGESGEFADMIKKHLFHNHPLDIEKVEKELGDILWYIAEACRVLELEMNKVAILNIYKLSQRYPNGFDPKDSLERKDE